MRKEIPILFSTPMVQAILEGRKTMTRRIIKPEPHPYGTEIIYSGKPWNKGKGYWHNRFKIKDDPVAYEIASLHDCPYGKPGDLLWVRESFAPTINLPIPYWYKASADEMACMMITWKPSIHMPKAAARIWLEVTGVRVERLQDISVEDAISEGIEPAGPPYNNVKKYGWRFKDYVNNNVCLPVASFKTLWQSINGLKSWEVNPWVWVMSFRVLSTKGKP